MNNKFTNNQTQEDLDLLASKNILKHLSEDNNKYKPNKLYVLTRKSFNNLVTNSRSNWNNLELKYKLKHAKKVYFSVVGGTFSKNNNSLHIKVSFGKENHKPYFAFEVYNKNTISNLADDAWDNDEFLQVDKEAIIISENFTNSSLLKACKLWYEQQVIDYLPSRGWEAEIFFNASELNV